MANKISAAIFDLDGTLIDSMPIWNDLSFNFLTARGVTPKPDLRERVSTMFLRESSQYVVDEYNLDCTAEDVLAFMHEQIDNFYINLVPPKEDVIPFLEKLKKANVKMCVATATERRLAIPALEHNGILGYFDEIFTCAELGVSKRSPLIFEKALEFLGTPKEKTYVFEDSPHAVETAVKAGFPVAAVYDESAAGKENEIRELSKVFFYKYAELDEFFDI
ncbi:MAG: HAD family phosphatase [Clostridia bacterium]|nr:HAD family phosphatase [Clostridia bacterium]MBR6634938.1 HAD family phosphatase [Clostridia bacterium]